ncbi:MAG: HAD family hydrolase [Desulfoprunum sp.]|uniref:HAD family hydrolase n=1 Tax=Desulfoprunum sp. TaxID=2020866 RepID=UPI00052D4566|nr:hypothetical protein JT06_04660 [Desulfobulbus sp. Tol-SR]
MLYRTAVFDLDGTLVDSLQDLAETANEMLAAAGYPQHPVEAYRYFVGDGMATLIRRIVPPALSEDACARCLAEFTQAYAARWQRNSCPYPGIHAMLSSLQNAGLKLAVLSNKPHEFTREFIRYFFPAQKFDAVFGQRPGVEKKPSPAGALEIAALLHVEPAECLYIGDTAVDMQTGKSAGMLTIGVLWGFRDRRELQEHHADLIVSHPLEIVEHALSCRC